MLEKFMYIYDATVQRVIDGDTVVIRIDLGFDVFITRTIRLAGIDTPELKGKTEKEQQAAEIATKKLKELTENKQIILGSKKFKTDKYNRYLGNLYVDNVCINEKLIKMGLAKEYITEKPSWNEIEFEEIIIKNRR